MSGHWEFTEVDREIAGDLADFLPGHVFDIHAHLYRTADIPTLPSPLFASGPDVVHFGEWQNRVGCQLGRSTLSGGLFFGIPDAGTCPDFANLFLISELEKAPSSRGLLLIAPSQSPSDLGNYLDHPQIMGFKPYHAYSKRKPTDVSILDEYLPEWAWEIANDRGWILMIHLVRHGALADPANMESLRRHYIAFPNAKVLLAHAGRGFHAPNTVNSVHQLRGLENIWFDSSAICEPQALIAILQEFGPRRLLWGSDFPVSEQRGRCVTVGDSFLWLNSEHTADVNYSGPVRPTLVGLESLRALRNASDQIGLNDEDLEDVFLNNALRLLSMLEESGRTKLLYEHAKERIPMGVQLLSKSPERMAPGCWPAYFREARGCECWDLDGRHYYDFSTNGIGSCLLGFRDPDVTRAVRRRIELGSMCSLNPPEEVYFADLLCELHPWAAQARFARSGGEVAAIAIRIARSVTKRSAVAICGYHGWHDWYMAANLDGGDALQGHLTSGLLPTGIPEELRQTAFTFPYGNQDQCADLLERQGDRLAAVIMEPCRYFDPPAEFLEWIREETRKRGILLILDEITIGWRLCCGGAHLKFHIEPDLAIFSKALGNGHPIAAVIGTREAMHGAQISFISSTYWTEGVGPAAALATLNKFRAVDIPSYVFDIGMKVKGIWRTYGDQYQLPIHLDEGYPCLAHFQFEHPDGKALQTYFTQLMLERGFLAGMMIYPTLAHNDAIMELYRVAVDEAFAEIADALSCGDIKKRLRGPVVNTGFPLFP